MARFLAGFEAASLEPRKGDLKRLEDRHKREQRRVRVDELRSGLATLVGRYRDELAAGGSHDDFLVAADAVQELCDGLAFNPNEGLQLRARDGPAPGAGRSSLSRHTPVVRSSRSCGGLWPRAGPAGADDGGQVRCPAADTTARIGVVDVAPVPVAATVAWVAMVAPSGAAGSATVADWRLDEPAGAHVLVDSGPSGLDGVVGASVGVGVVEQGATAHRFSTVAPDTSPLDPQRLDLVAHDDRLNPGTEDYAMTVRLRTTSPQGNVVQKGQSSSTGGYMKIDMDDGRVACGVIGSSGSLHLRSARSIADGAWHEVRCVRRADEMRAERRRGRGRPSAWRDRPGRQHVARHDRREVQLQPGIGRLRLLLG